MNNVNIAATTNSNDARAFHGPISSDGLPVSWYSRSAPRFPPTEQGLANLRSIIEADFAGMNDHAVIETRARLADLRFFDMTKVGRTVIGPLNINPDAYFTAPAKKIQFAEWIIKRALETGHSLDEIVSAIKTFPDSQHWTNKKNTSTPVQAKTRVQNVPKPAPAANDEPKQAPTPKADVPGMNISLPSLLEIIQKTAGNMDDILYTAINQAMKDINHRIDTMGAKHIHVHHHKPDNTTETVRLDRQHMTFEWLLDSCRVRDHEGNRMNVWLTGPAGSGKTTAAKNVAKALRLPFYFTGAVDNEYKLKGFMDAQGRCTNPEFRKAWEHGGVFLFDEIDGSHPGAVLAFNAALANGLCDFPDATIPRHPDCVIIAAANTWGTGATMQYVGRMQQDGASTDRFAMIPWDYDEDMEMATCGNKEWCAKVQRWRRNMMQQGIRAIISPRASYQGAAFLAAGMDEDKVIQMTIKRGLDTAQWSAINR